MHVLTINLRHIHKAIYMHLVIGWCTTRPHRSSLIAHDHYVLAVASMELGLLYLDQGMLDHAERQLLSAKNDYRGYHSESRINLKIHAGLTQIVKTKTPL
jgi:Tfp pilus assembly protein PilF